MAIDVGAFGGGCTIESELFICDIHGTPIREINGQVLDCEVSWNIDREGGTAMRCTFTLIEREPGSGILPQNTFISPRITYRWGDGTVRSTRLGVFLVGLPRKTISDVGVVTRYEGCRDLTWILFNSTLTKALNITAGTNYGAAIASVFTAAGLTNISVRATSRTLAADRTFRRGLHRREITSLLAKAIGWYNAFMDLNGTMTTLPYRDWNKVEPVGIITPKVKIGAIEPVHTIEEIPNTIMATMQRSGEQPIIRYAFNTDPASPISLQNIIPEGRRITRQINDSNVETIADLEALARQGLIDAASMETRYRLTLKPDPSWLGIHRTIDLDPSLTQHGEPMAGRYRILGWRVGTTPETAPIELTIGRTIAASSVLQVAP